MGAWESIATRNNRDDWFNTSLMCSKHCALCPIDIDLDTAVNLELNQEFLQLKDYDINPKKMKLTNTGHTLQLTGEWDSSSPYILLDGVRYDFKNIHFHWGVDNSSGCEHSISDIRFPMEMHVVHEAENGSSSQIISNEETVNKTKSKTGDDATNVIEMDDDYKTSRANEQQNKDEEQESESEKSVEEDYNEAQNDGVKCNGQCNDIKTNKNSKAEIQDQISVDSINNENITEAKANKKKNKELNKKKAVDSGGSFSSINDEELSSHGDEDVKDDDDREVNDKKGKDKKGKDKKGKDKKGKDKKGNVNEGEENDASDNKSDDHSSHEDVNDEDDKKENDKKGKDKKGKEKKGKNKKGNDETGNVNEGEENDVDIKGESDSQPDLNEIFDDIFYGDDETDEKSSTKKKNKKDKKEKSGKKSNNEGKDEENIDEPNSSNFSDENEPNVDEQSNKLKESNSDESSVEEDNSDELTSVESKDKKLKGQDPDADKSVDENSDEVSDKLNENELDTNKSNADKPNDEEKDKQGELIIKGKPLYFNSQNKIDGDDDDDDNDENENDTNKTDVNEVSNFPDDSIIENYIDGNKKYLVIGKVFLMGKNINKTLLPITDFLESIINSHSSIYIPPFPLSQLIKNMKEFATYEGSLTIPPYTERVSWVINLKMGFISDHQLELIRKLLDDNGHAISPNFRQTQPLEGRTITRFYNKSED